MLSKIRYICNKEIETQGIDEDDEYDNFKLCYLIIEQAQVIMFIISKKIFIEKS